MDYRNGFKACPFCGGTPKVIQPEEGRYAGLFRVEHRCPVIGYIEISDWTEVLDYSITKWNTRSEEESRYNIWSRAVEATKKACAEALSYAVMRPWCHWSDMEKAIMQVEVKL
jgi:hypothetical protein